jgi:hypothetical protein
MDKVKVDESQKWKYWAKAHVIRCTWRSAKMKFSAKAHVIWCTWMSAKETSRRRRVGKFQTQRGARARHTQTSKTSNSYSHQTHTLLFFKSLRKPWFHITPKSGEMRVGSRIDFTLLPQPAGRLAASWHMVNGVCKWFKLDFKIQTFLHHLNKVVLEL